MGNEAELEAMIVALVTEKLRDLVQESVQSWGPALLAEQVRAEIERIKGASEVEARAVVEPAEPYEGFDEQVCALFRPQIYALARQLASREVAYALPEVAEQMILAELERL
ncbi:MAG: hypothetical protein HQL80_01990 [Magnetococcales bacterium]|nr:hypothetical protein [Magnetococcales bacterium]MBF0582987.1 hypothetical protein [Magnetococcales bacterium]